MPLETNFPYNPADFRPILQPGQSARLRRGAGRDTDIDVEVESIFPLGQHRHDFGVISANSLDNDCTHLDMPPGEMAQYRYIPRGLFDIHLQHPGGVDIYRTNGSVKGNKIQGWFVRPGADDKDEMLQVRSFMFASSEFFVFEEETPRFDLYPYAPATRGQRAYIDFFGWGFVLKKYRGSGTPLMTLWVNGKAKGEKLGSG